MVCKETSEKNLTVVVYSKMVRKKKTTVADLHFSLSSSLYFSSHLSLSSHLYLSSYLSFCCRLKLSSHLRLSCLSPSSHFSSLMSLSLHSSLARSPSLSLSLSLFISLSLSFYLSCQLCLSLLIDNDNDNNHLLRRLSLCTHSYDLLCVPECVHSLIGELLALCRNKLCMSICSDLVPLERSGLVPALEMEMCLRLRCAFGVLAMCLRCAVVSVVCVCLCLCLSLSVDWCGVVIVVVAVGVAHLQLSGGLSSMRCLLYLDIQSRRGDIIWLPLRGS